MLAGKYRIKGSYYVTRAKNRGTLHQFPYFGVSLLERTKDMDKPSQFAFVVSTKIANLAVDRNRIKRMLTEAVRHECTRLVNGYDVVFLAKTSIAHQPTDKVMQETKQALKKLKLIK